MSTVPSRCAYLMTLGLLLPVWTRLAGQWWLLPINEQLAGCLMLWCTPFVLVAVGDSFPLVQLYRVLCSLQSCAILTIHDRGALRAFTTIASNHFPLCRFRMESVNPGTQIAELGAR